jgi:hypothetical protein
MKPYPPGAVASLVFGICALIAGMVPLFGMLLGLIATIQSRRADSFLREDHDRYQVTSLPVAGLVTGIIGITMSLVSTLWVLFWFAIIGAIATAATHQPMHVEPVLLW